MMMKGTINPSKALVIRINLLFVALFFFIYVVLLLRPSTPGYHLDYPATSNEHHHHHPKVEAGVLKIKAAALEEKKVLENSKKKLMTVIREKPRFLSEMGLGTRSSSIKIGMVNMNADETSDWESHGKLITVEFERVSGYLQWKDLFPEWIDEEEKSQGTSCPEIPMPDFMAYDEMDIVVAKLPCGYPKKGWNRDVFRLQVHLIAANLAVKRGKRYGGTTTRTKMVFLSACRPMMEMFRCDDMVRNEGDWWWYEPEMSRLEHKVSLPIGSCKLALPLWEKGSIDRQSKDITDAHSKKFTVRIAGRRRREAYATVLHSSETYVCGAIALAQSILATGTNRDLVLLLDKSISQPKRDALAASGWQIRIITRIRNPRAEKNSYNEYNYSKFRLWQLTD